MIQKLIRIGTSAAVIIPKKSLEELGFRIGDNVKVEIDEKNHQVNIKSAKKNNRELNDWTKGFIDKYRIDLEELAKR